MQSRAREGIAALAFLVHGGCGGLGPKPDAPAPQVAVPAAWSTGTRSDQGEVATVLATWWQQFEDPLLDQLIAQAMPSAPDVRSAQARLHQARANRDLAQAGLVPTVKSAVTATSSKTGVRAGGNGVTSGLREHAQTQS